MAPPKKRKKHCNERSDSIRTWQLYSGREVGQTPQREQVPRSQAGLSIGAEPERGDAAPGAGRWPETLQRHSRREEPSC
jgi:hypothetical protein